MQAQPSHSADSPAAKAALTRRRNHTLARAGAYGDLLRELWLAQKASDQANSRPANEVQRLRGGSLGLAEHNYRASREARRRDFLAKEAHLGAACRLLLTMPWVRWGWHLAAQEYDAGDCWACFGTGELTQCIECGGRGIVVTGEECDSCSGLCNPAYCDACGGNFVKGGRASCKQCHGTGYWACENCDGSGKQILWEAECTGCAGSGECDPVVCPYCRGEGFYGLRPRPRLYVLSVDLPTGQASFDCRVRGAGPEYRWGRDGTVGATGERIVAAIDELAASLRERAASRASVAWKHAA